MLTDPLAVTYDGSAKSLPRVGAGSNGTTYRTADGEFEIKISNVAVQQDGSARVTIGLTRRLPDPTPGDVFDNYRMIRNGFSITYTFDSSSRANVSVDIPLLRTALLALVDSTLQGRIIAGEK